MKAKETYLSRDFRETAAQRFPARAKELNVSGSWKTIVPMTADVTGSTEARIEARLDGMPIAGWIISVIAMKFYPLTGKKMIEIEDQIAKLQLKQTKE